MLKSLRKPAVIFSFCIILSFVFLSAGCTVGNADANSLNSITEGSIKQSAENTASTEPAGTITEDQVDALTENTTAENTVNTDDGIAKTCLRNKSCSYPGKCNDYTDSDNNGLCDLGQS